MSLILLHVDNKSLCVKQSEVLVLFLKYSLGVFDRSKPLPTGGYLEQVCNSYFKHRGEV